MMWAKTMPVVLALAAAVPSVCGANDGEPRTRTLTYDAEKREWVEIPPPPPGTAAGDLHLIRAQIQSKEYRRALSAIKKHIKTYGEDDPVYPEVLLAKADGLIGRKAYDKAHDVLQAFLNEYGGMAVTSEALRLEFIIAETYLTGVKRKFLGMRLLSGEEEAYRILDEISIDHPESSLAEAAIKTKGDYLFKKGDHLLAELEYTRLIQEYPRSRYHQYALRRTAESALASHGGVDYDEAALIEAEERYREYRSRYTGAADREGVGLILTGIREQRAEKEFSIGRYYERTNHPGTAVFHYRTVRSQWPDTRAGTNATARLELLGAAEVASSAGS